MYKKSRREAQDQEARGTARPPRVAEKDRGRSEKARDPTDPLNTLLQQGAEAKVTGVARRVSPERFVSKPSDRSEDARIRGGDDVNSPAAALKSSAMKSSAAAPALAESPAKPRRPEKSAGLTLAIEDEHNHFASMLNKRMMKYCDEPDSLHESPGNRFGVEADKYKDRQMRAYEAEDRALNELQILERQGGRGEVRGLSKAGTEAPREVTAGAFSYEVYRPPGHVAQPAAVTNANTSFQRQAAPSQPPPSRSNMDPSIVAPLPSWAFSPGRVPPLAPVNSSSPHVVQDDLRSSSKEDGPRRSSYTKDKDGTRDLTSSHTTHVHRRQPGREGMMLPSVRSGGTPRLPAASQNEAILRPPQTRGAIAHRAPESCLQALAAIDRSDLRSR